MTIDEIKKIVDESDDYKFLKTDPNLKNPIIIGLGGSYAYGLNKKTSDLDIRGIALNSKSEILLGKDFEQVVETNTDTTMYSFNKILTLLSNCNPNTIEILGLEKDQYLFLSELGEYLIKNSDMFLSKKCIHTFSGYAISQLRRLENKSVREVNQANREKHILKTIECARYDFEERYFDHDKDSIKLYIDESNRDDYETEVFMDINLTKYPLRDWAGMWNEMKSIVSSYSKLAQRNSKAITHDKLGKHMAHLLRLYIMCIDILTKHQIITKRVDEHDLLMSIRNGEFLDDNNQPTTDFYDLLKEYEEKFDIAVHNTTLQDLPDYKRIEELKISVNEKIVRGEL